MDPTKNHFTKWKFHNLFSLSRISFYDENFVSRQNSIEIETREGKQEREFTEIRCCSDGMQKREVKHKMNENVVNENCERFVVGGVVWIERKS